MADQTNQAASPTPGYIQGVTTIYDNVRYWSDKTNFSLWTFPGDFYVNCQDNLHLSANDITAILATALIITLVRYVLNWTTFDVSDEDVCVLYYLL